MKCSYKTANGRMMFEITGESQKELFRQIAEIQETFEPDACGMCPGANIRFVTRQIDSNTFYEWTCRDCGATLQLGQHKQGGTLFPKRSEGWKIRAGQTNAANR